MLQSLQVNRNIDAVHRVLDRIVEDVGNSRAQFVGIASDANTCPIAGRLNQAQNLGRKMMPGASESPLMKVVPAFVLLIAAALFWYARGQEKKRVLR